MRRTPTAPYLGVPPPTVSTSSTTAGASFTLSATVHNDGSRFSGFDDQSLVFLFRLRTSGTFRSGIARVRYRSN